MKFFEKIGKVLSRIFGRKPDVRAEAKFVVEREEVTIIIPEDPETLGTSSKSATETLQQTVEVVSAVPVTEGVSVEPAPSVGVIDAPSGADISVEVKVHAPVDAKVRVTVDVDQPAEASRKKKRAAPTPGIDYWCRHEDEGIKLNSYTKYHAVNANKELMLDHDEVKALESQFLDDLEICYGEDFFADDEPFGTAPTQKQISTYYGLCHQCEDMGLDYNRKDRPMTYREYQLAIMGLCRVLRLPQKVARTANL